MNKQECDVLLSLVKTPYCNQRQLALDSGYSLGVVNSALKQLVADGLLDGEFKLTKKGKLLVNENKPQRAVILAAGLGLRMIPINAESPKALLEVKGETLIERLISQLNAVGIKEIVVVVGFMKERFEYLIDKYSVKLIVNRDYATKNNLHSLALAEKYLENAYIIPCDMWCRENPFNQNELYSWYMVSECKSVKSSVRVNRKQELVKVSASADGNSMIGISFLDKSTAKIIKEKLHQMNELSQYDGAFWEETAFDKNKMLLFARLVDTDFALEINTFEQLREIDSGSRQLRADIIKKIAQVMGVDTSELQNITIQKKGMTNRSFLFNCKGKRYIMRIPGEGTDNLIDRVGEAAVYNAVSGKGICDDVIYINPENGYKITEFLENSVCCDPENIEDVKKCMQMLRSFHNKAVKVDHVFDIFEKIDYYESLWDGTPSEYCDYATTKANVLSLKEYIEEHKLPYCLTHIDAVPDNFLIFEDADGKEQIRLIDWEYAGMQDPHVDIAMFAVYAMYDRKHIEALIDAYFPEGCPIATRIKIYCYISACGMLWSNWCEYKRNLGVEFGEYSLYQYRFAKEYYKIALQELEKVKESNNA